MKQSKSGSLSDGNSLSIGPEGEEIEISVFGPGYGESILLHIGMNQWIIVDSCVFPGEDKPAPLQYLEQINVDYSESVKVLVATHWHDDHIRGLGNIFRACKKAEFICSEALRQDEFIELVKIYGNNIISEYSGINEFNEVLEELIERRHKIGQNHTPKFAISERLLWRELFGNKKDCSLYSLSPCDAAVLAAKLNIINLFPKENENLRVIPKITPNHAAVVLWLSIDNHLNILLGSDLEEDNSYKGWSVIVDSKTRPFGKAFFFKIPHHGSKNADHPGVWKEMLIQNPFAVLTPFLKGRKLPTLKDTERICSNTAKAYTTALSGEQRKLKRSSVVEKSIKETVRKIKLIDSDYGHVRFRKNLSNNHSTIELFGKSALLCT